MRVQPDQVEDNDDLDDGHEQVEVFAGLLFVEYGEEAAEVGAVGHERLDFEEDIGFVCLVVCDKFSDVFVAWMCIFIDREASLWHFLEEFVFDRFLLVRFISFEIFIKRLPWHISDSIYMPIF